MDWYLEMSIILVPTVIVFRLFRSKIKPMKRVMTWLAAFFASMYLVQTINSIILTNDLLPTEWAHLPMQAIATCILILFVPIREVAPEPEKEEKSSGGKNTPTTTRRFRKK
ncbi:MAG: hypothetical protein FWF06_05735 [Symbiobacteriaceae bacterium]|nr:hypothetical protein [Symbiobacteriaceae bacterium]